MSFSIQKYFEVLEQLLGEQGCPWSKEQSLSTICHHVIEEAYEVLDASKKEDPEKIREELGDLFFTISFLTTLALKQYNLDFDQIVKTGADKIVRRSPHVFENPRALTLKELREQWEASKAKERKEKKEDPLHSVAPSLPTLNRAMKWAELANKYGYTPSFNSDSLGDQMLDLVFKGANSFKNVDALFENSLKDFEEEFKEWLIKERPEILN